MARYANVSDDFFVNMHLNTEIDLPSNRDTVLHFFEQLQRRYPTMRNFFARERGEFVLEEEKEKGQYRWAAIEARRVCSGHVNPASVEEALDQHRMILEMSPHILSVSGLDCESLNLMYCFDFNYKGNHNELVAEALGMVPAYERLAHMPGTRMVGFDPSILLSLDEDCRTQCRLSIETRTSAYHIRTGEYPEEQLSVFLTARRFGGLNPGENFPEVLEKLATICRELTDGYLIDAVLKPLQNTIAMR